MIKTVEIHHSMNKANTAKDVATHGTGEVAMTHDEAERTLTSRTATDAQRHFDKAHAAPESTPAMLTRSAATAGRTGAQDPHGIASRTLSEGHRFLLFLQKRYGNQYVQRFLASPSSPKVTGSLKRPGHDSVLAKPSSELSPKSGSKAGVLRQTADSSARSGTPAKPIPGTLVIENVDGPNIESIIGLIQNLAYQSAGGNANNADFRTHVGQAIDKSVGANLNPRSQHIEFTETTGLNMRWTLPTVWARKICWEAAEPERRPGSLEDPLRQPNKLLRRRRIRPR
ncbi:hypothetical protein [Paraburkholderia sp. BR13444]|uniref:hypothetical protein n=1 Tax=Paraburkholderia sp. BR13444 TaxID=3236997 RepID=UPI0034CFA501